jgi:cellulose synthase/poly-beta-1,6-N-acetylglucosamine synthase-like glycosyltransferase
VTIPSVTLEEAPIAFGAWLRQRSRWMKGWMHPQSSHYFLRIISRLRPPIPRLMDPSQHHRNKLEW